MRLRATYMLFVAILISGCYDSADTPGPVRTSMSANTTLANLRSMYKGYTFEVTDDIIVEGVVTSSDKAGNFYRTFTISDGTAGAEIMAGTSDLHNSYPPGSMISVKVKGCALGMSRSVMQIGMMPDSFEYYETDYFYSDVLLDRHMVRSGKSGSVDILTLEYEELTPSACGMPVRICALNPVDTSDTGTCTWAGYRCFTDDNGNNIYTYTSQYADYADHTLPTADVDITGILQYGEISGISGSHYIIKMRSEEDCHIHNGIH